MQTVLGESEDAVIEICTDFLRVVVYIHTIEIYNSESIIVFCIQFYHAYLFPKRIK